MKKKNLFIIPLLALILSGCNPGSDTSNPTSTPSNSTSNDISETTTTKEGESSSSESKTSSETSTDKDTSTSKESSTESESSTDKESSTSKETSTESESSSSSSTSSDDIPEGPNADHTVDKGNLPCGQEWLSRPDNVNYPKKIDDTTEEDLMLEYLPDNYSFIYGNNKTNGDFYATNNHGGGLRLNKKMKGIQTPVWSSWESNWVKVEVAFNVNFYQAGQEKHSGKETIPYLIYGFDIHGDLIETVQLKAPDKIAESNGESTFAYDITNPKIRYCELRLNDRPYNKVNNKYHNVAMKSVRIRAYERK